MSDSEKRQNAGFMCKLLFGVCHCVQCIEPKEALIISKSKCAAQCTFEDELEKEGTEKSGVIVFPLAKVLVC